MCLLPIFDIDTQSGLATTANMVLQYVPSSAYSSVIPPPLLCVFA